MKEIFEKTLLLSGFKQECNLIDYKHKIDMLNYLHIRLYDNGFSIILGRISCIINTNATKISYDKIQETMFNDIEFYIKGFRENLIKSKSIVRNKKIKKLLAL